MADHPAIKECDIRGPFPAEVSVPLFERAGRNFARQVAAASFPSRAPRTVVVGGDGRGSTAELREALCGGLFAGGAAILDVAGVLPTPALYWAREALAAQAVAIVTASHSPPDWNGLKVMNGPLPPLPADIRALAAEPQAPGGRGFRHRVDGVLEGYVAARLAPWAAAGLADLRVAVDPGGGCMAGVATRVFGALGARVHAINDELDPAFRKRHPDCAVPKHLAELADATCTTGSAVGIAFDGDGDRLAIFDDRGRHVPPEKVAMLLIDGPLPLAPGDAVVLDIKASMQLERVVESKGGRPIRQKSGHAYMKRAVIEERAVLGTEVSGHQFFGALSGIDDPLYAALLLAGELASGGARLSERVDALPEFHLTPDLRLKIGDEAIDRLQEALPARFPDARVERIDGVRLVFPDGWMLARRSITEPACTLRFEGVDATALDSLRARFAAAFPELRTALDAASGRF